MTHDDEQWNAEMFRAVLDRPHCRGIDHIASITGNKNLTYTQPAEQQFGWHAAVGTTDHRCPWRLRLGNLAPLLQQVERAELRRSDEFFVAGFQPSDRFIHRDVGRRHGAGRAAAPKACYGDVCRTEREKSTPMRRRLTLFDAHR